MPSFVKGPCGEKITVGTRIRIVCPRRNIINEIWGGKLETIPPGTEGEVTSIDDLGFLHGTWGKPDVIAGLDRIEVLDLPEEEKSLPESPDPHACSEPSLFD